jgi:hypothetical protein
MNCPNSANCPVRDPKKNTLGPVYNATCAPIEATCRTAAKYNGDNNAK